MDSKVRHILFVCGQNRMRSRTAEVLFGGSDDYICQSAGVSRHSRVKLEPSLVELLETKVKAYLAHE
ncbi:MAG: hypothetical protein IH591_01970 [Bacteroidales bacterium]|nr:hypothetical protein [Bacteroidales bacterium]